MKKIINLFLFSLLFMQTILSQGWEPLYFLPEAVEGATSTASDGYGVHLVGVYNGVAKHFWVGNDNTVVWSQLAVTGGEMPQVTVYDGITRVTMKVTISNQQRIRVYQSEDGGYAWTQLLPDYTPIGQPPVYNLYAYSDQYGTHITWDNNPNSDPNYFQNEVYYVRVNQSPAFVNFKNVTDLSSPSQGGRPKVAVAGNKASITFLSPSGFTLTSRDLNLDNGTWDSNYKFGGENSPHYTISEASIGDMFYTVGTSDVITGGDQVLFFSYRQKDASSWTTTSISSTGGGYDINKRNMLISNEGLLHIVNYIPGEGVFAQSFNPSEGYWSDPEEIEGYTNDQIPESPMIAGGGNMVYIVSSKVHILRFISI